MMKTEDDKLKILISCRKLLSYVAHFNFCISQLCKNVHDSRSMDYVSRLACKRLLRESCVSDLIDFRCHNAGLPTVYFRIKGHGKRARRGSYHTVQHGYGTVKVIVLFLK